MQTSLGVFAKDRDRVEHAVFFFELREVDAEGLLGLTPAEGFLTLWR